MSGQAGQTRGEHGLRPTDDGRVIVMAAPKLTNYFKTFMTDAQG
jgi:hypothetical protein